MPSGIDTLTPLSPQAFLLAALEDFSTSDIATILGAGVRTIHKHVENIFRKLGCETRAAAAVTAQEVLRPGSALSA